MFVWTARRGLCSSRIAFRGKARNASVPCKDKSRQHKCVAQSVLSLLLTVTATKAPSLRTRPTDRINSSYTNHDGNPPHPIRVAPPPCVRPTRSKVIHIPGYTLEEKVKIAEAYLIPKQMRKNGVGPEHMLLPRSTVLRVASSYTREAGVRQLERELAAVCRHVALKVRWGAGFGLGGKGSDQAI